MYGPVARRRSPQTFGLFALVTALATLAALLQIAEPAQAQGVRVEVRDKELHVGNYVFVGISGGAERLPYTLFHCAQVGKAVNCNKRTESAHYERITGAYVPAERLVVVRNKVFDCATTEVSCFVRYKDETFEKDLPLRYSSARPLPALTLNADTVRGARPVAAKANSFYGDRKIPAQLKNFKVYQCPSIPNKIDSDHCVRLATIAYGGSRSVTPLRALHADGKVIDCAAEAAACLLSINLIPMTNSPLLFEPASSPLPEQTASLAKTDGLGNFEPVDLTVQTPLVTHGKVLQCAQRTGSKRPVCNTLNKRFEVQGSRAGALGIRTMPVTVRRYILDRRSKAFDCNKQNIKCFVVAKGPRGLTFGDPIPVTFDPNDTSVPPQLILPEGPYTDGQKILVEVRGFSSGATARSVCHTEVRRQKCGIGEQAGADGATGSIFVPVTLIKVPNCSDLATTTCEIRITTKPATRTLVAKIAFE